MANVPRIGVVGTGWWATQYHIPSLAEYDGAELVALADRDPDRLSAAAKRFGVDTTFVESEELFASGVVDGVVIAVPHAFHYPLAKAALQAGIHVLLEKPMVLKAWHAWDLVRTAEAHDRILVLGYTYQYSDSAETVRDAIQSGRIGELVHVSGLFSSMVESYFRGQPADYESVFQFGVTGPREDTYADPEIAGGGQGMTQVTHAMGMVLWATGRRAEEVTAFMANRDLRVDLVDAIAYRLDNGAIGTMAATGTVAPGLPAQQEFRYYGTEGFILQDLVTGAVGVHLNDGTTEHVGPLDDPYPAHLPSRTLADLIARQGYNPAPPEPAARVVEFLEAAYTSACRGSAPVRVADLPRGTDDGSGDDR